MGTWSLIYATEPNEPKLVPAIKVVAGTAKALRDAVLNAADVKVLYLVKTGVWRAITCSAVLPTTDRIQVIAQGFLALASNSPPGDGFAAESFLFDSHGYFAHSHYDAVTGRHGSGTLAATPMRWYVRDYQLPFWANARDQLPSVVKRR